ncbi:MAG: hypothetical protein QOI15_1484 [Pseudonocardiales bacterium]|nr:hypothetical protein [Pseudonocardiales bacterium]
MVAQFAPLAVLAVLAAAFLYLVFEPGRWGRASGVVAVAVLVAAVLRAVVPPTRVGLLAVRSRWFDTATYLVLGGLILAVDLRLHA